jgi:ubiquinone/menaquinone biosynthesis C-methylase UbiE
MSGETDYAAHATMPARTGSYPVETRAEEIGRLRMQADAMAFDAGIMLDRIGVGTGWRCLDLACGTGGIADQLADRVGTEGRVVGLDADAEILEVAKRDANARGHTAIDWVHGDAYRAPLDGDAFDLVHMRFILSTAGQVDVLLAEALRLVCPGGVVAAQEPDIEPLHCYPSHPAWDRLKAALTAAFERGSDIRLARSLYRQFKGLGLTDVRYRPFLVGFTSADPMADYLPQTILSIRSHLTAHGILSAGEVDDLVAALRGHMADPDTISTSYLVAQVWGRKPN